MCITDHRPRRKREAYEEMGEVAGDTGNWLHVNAGNRIRRMVSSPAADKFGTYLLQRVFDGV